MSTRRFSTFEGVFTPCLLSILGVIMYLRLGWVVGQSGLAGAILIIVLANLITLATALSMSSVVTNIRIGAGGAYSIITKSLGIEMGGAIGIPLYISQAISVAFYIAGFTECWIYVFPDQPGLLISLGLWLALLTVTCLSTKLAFKIQYVIMAIIGASFVSIFGNTGMLSADFFAQWQSSTAGETSLEGFWQVFAVFFPAVTGIMAGASLSGELKDPKRSIPRGTLSAIGVSFVIYIVLAWWFAQKVPQDVLLNNNYVAISIGLWPKLVIAGIMGATLSSALSTAVGSPRVLMALGKNSILPFSRSLARVNANGEPTTAILFTFLIALATILLGSLNQIATLLTMFFLVTYGMINLTVFIEQTIGIVSFRPTFKVPRIVSLSGSLGCLIVMFIIDFKFSLVAFAVIILIYYILLKRGVTGYSPDIRSGTLVFMAEQFAKAANRLPYYPKIWKPNVLVIDSGHKSFERVVPFIRNIVYPAGRLCVVKLAHQADSKDQDERALAEQLNPLEGEGVFVEMTAIEAESKECSAVAAIQTLKGMFFPPNTLFQILDEDSSTREYTELVLSKSVEVGMGVVILGLHQKLGFSQESIINLWIRRESPNINLAILVALQLERNWDGRIRLIQVAEAGEEAEDSRAYLLKLKDLMRLSQTVEVEVMQGDFKTVLQDAPMADINIFGMQETLNMESIRFIHQHMPTSVLFIKDSKHESALA